MTDHIKCVKCGHEWVPDGKHLSRIAECPHCHMKMVVDEKTSKDIRHTGAWVIGFICVILGMGMYEYSMHQNMILLFLAGTAALGCVAYINQFTLWLTWKKKGLTFRAMRQEEIKAWKHADKGKKK